MKMYLGSINDKVWDVVENEFVVLDPTKLTHQQWQDQQTMQYHGTQHNI